MEDLKTLQITYARLTYTSDYFDKCFELLKELISKDKAYLDNTPLEKMREERNKKIDSVCRNQTIEQNLELF
jgi:glutamyl/glutaminyl-tRNA synthetase